MQLTGWTNKSAGFKSGVGQILHSLLLGARNLMLIVWVAASTPFAFKGAKHAAWGRGVMGLGCASTGTYALTTIIPLKVHEPYTLLGFISSPRTGS